MATGTNVIDGDLLVRGKANFASLNIPAGTVTDAMIEALAGIAASKLQHVHRKEFAQGSASNAAAATQVIHVVIGTTATVMSVKAGAVVPAIGAATATVDIKHNGTSILSSAITLNSSQTARQLVSATISTPALAAGDVLEIVITAAAGGGTLAQGVFAVVDIFEDAQ